MKINPLPLYLIGLYFYFPWTNTALGVNTQIDDNQEKCNYQLEDIRPHITSEEKNQINPNIIQKVFTLRWTEGHRQLHGKLTLYCTINNASNEADASSRLTPKELIIEEDSGGRYARHVAWQKDLKAINWHPKVAYVNYIIGDGQRDPVNDFVACDTTNNIPCIYFSVQEKNINSSQIKSALSIIEKISILKP